MRLLKNIFSTLVWVLLGLYLLFIIGVNTPVGQRYLARRAAGVLSGVLGTSVSIGLLEYDFLSQVTLRDIRVLDQQGHPMLRAERLSTRVDLLPLAEGRISISTAQLFGVEADLYQRDSISPPNFQFVLDSLASKDTTQTSALDLRVNSLIVRRTALRFHRLDVAETPGRLNPRHLSLSDVSAHVVLKKLAEDSLNVTVKRLSLREQSGLEVNRLSFRLAAGRHELRLADFLLRMPATQLALDDTRATYRFRGDTLERSSLHFSGGIAPSVLSPADVACVLPPLASLPGALSVSARFEGEGDDVQLSSLVADSPSADLHADLSASVRQLSAAAPAWSAQIRDLSFSSKTIGAVLQAIGHQSSMPLPAALARLGQVHLSATASGQGTDVVQTDGRLTTDVGNAQVTLNAQGQRHVQGSIRTDGVQLDQLLADPRLGLLAADVNFSGALPTGQPLSLQADATVRQFSFKGRRYDNIRLDGRYGDGALQARVAMDDDNLRGRLQADLRGHDANDLEGTLALQSLYVRLPDDRSYALDSLGIATGFDADGRHYAQLGADFGHARLTGRFDYATLVQSVTNFIAAKLPTLPGLPKPDPTTRNNFALAATITKSDWLETLLGVPVRLTQPLTVDVAVNDQSQQLSVSCDAPQFYYKDSKYDNCHLTIFSPLGTLLYEVGATRAMADGTSMNLLVTGSAYNNQLTTSLLWDNHADTPLSGKLTARTQFGTTFDGRQQATISVVPSQMVIRDATWDIRPCTMVWSPGQLSVGGFAIEHDGQYLTASGVASESSRDTLAVRMRDIDVGYVLDLVNFHAVDFDGQATGGGTLRSVLGNLEADGRLTVSRFEFEHGRMGTLDAAVTWNADQQQIDIHATADDGPDARTLVDGYVSPRRNYIDLGIRADGTHVDFAHSFLQSFVSDISGHARGALRLAGPLDAINLTGDLSLNGKVHVSTLGCTYELRGDSIHFAPNEIQLAHFPLYDLQGNEAMLTGAIHHKELTRMTYDIGVDARNLLAYHFTDFGDDTFYGTVFATGRVTITGRPGSVAIEADVTPEQGSRFVYNAASPDAISGQDFIEWGSPDTQRHQGTQNSQGSQNALAARSDLTLLLRINATPKAEIRLLMDATTEDYITLRGSGDLQASFYNKGGFNLFGTYRVSEGTYGLTIQNIIRKHFTFREGGTIVFGGDPYDAALQLQAQHTVSGVSLSDLNVGRSFSNTVRVNCLMNITGQPRQPLIDFDLEMPNVNSDEQQMVRSLINSEEEMNQQVVYLLAVGRFYPQRANNADADDDAPSKTSLAMQSLLSGTLSGQINTLLSRVIQNGQWNFGANISTGDEGWGNAEYEGLVSGRLLNNRLLINGQFGYRDNATTDNPSFIGDFDIRYLLLPNGNLAVKVYNQTNDRYFTRSSLNTQGLGLIIKKDFDDIPDLLGVKRKRKKNLLR